VQEYSSHLQFCFYFYLCCTKKFSSTEKRNNEQQNEMAQDEVSMNNGMKWRLFIVPIKVQHVRADLLLTFTIELQDLSK